ncbi:hypothetical protein AAHC03_017011 [Spirometra sp. Aus1]
MASRDFALPGGISFPSITRVDAACAYTSGRSGNQRNYFVVQSPTLEMKPKGTDKMLHPSSRKAKKRISQAHHVSKINKRKKLRKCKDELKRLKLAWFKDNIPKDATSLSDLEIKQLMAKYLRRFSAETKAERKEVENCSVSMSIDMSNAFVEQEMREYKTAGLSIPDLTSKVNVEKLRNWNGEVAQMATVPMTVVKHTDNKK